MFNNFIKNRIEKEEFKDNKAAQLKKAYEHLFNSEENRLAATRVLDDLVTRFHLYSSTYSDNVNKMAVNEGNRQVVLHILAMSAKNEAFMTELEKFINRD